MLETVISCSSYNGSQRLRWLLKSLAMRTPELRDGRARVVVVDDGSPNPTVTREAVNEFAGQIPLDYVEHGSNRGISAGWNTGARLHACKYVVEINDDVIVPSTGVEGVSWLDPMIYVLANSPGVGMVGPNWHAFLPEDVSRLLESVDSDRAVTPRDPVSKAPTPSRRDLEPCDPGRVMAPGGQCFAFRRSDFDAWGGFDEGYKSFFEENDFSTVMCSGRRSADEPQSFERKIGVGLNWAQVWHQWSACFGANPHLEASERMRVSHTHYARKWKTPPGMNPFDHTNPTYLRTIPDVEVKFLRGVSGEKWRCVMRSDGACVEQRRDS